MATFLTAACVLASSAQAMPQAYSPNFCRVLAENGQGVPALKVNLFGQEVEFTDYPMQGHYIIEPDLPLLNHALLIHIDKRGHTELWYKGKSVDSNGRVFYSIHSFVHPEKKLRPGLLIAIHKLPEDFKTKFASYIQNYHQNFVLTCTQAVCNSLNALEVIDANGLRNLRPSRLLKFFVTLPESEKERLGIEFVRLGVDPVEHLKAIEARETAAMRDARNVTLISGAAVTTVSTLALVFAHFIAGWF